VFTGILLGLNRGLSLLVPPFLSFHPFSSILLSLPLPLVLLPPYVGLMFMGILLGLHAGLSILVPPFLSFPLLPPFSFLLSPFFRLSPFSLSFLPFSPFPGTILYKFGVYVGLVFTGILLGLNAGLSLVPNFGVQIFNFIIFIVGRSSVWCILGHYANVMFGMEEGGREG
jgi:hypothetical protein